MFWALISPLRHTSEPPRFGPNHPIRVAFERHGAAVARHPAIFIVVSITISVILSFPSVFLYLNASPGPSSVTHHVWTSATPYNYPEAEPDVVIRQAWIQGSYMDALSPDVLKEGLGIQNALLGPEVTCDGGLPDSDRIHGGFKNTSDDLLDSDGISRFAATGLFFHSPLLYFNCSLKALDRNKSEIVDMVNENVERQSFADVRLRFGTVFAGKEFSHNKIVAADALVISLFHAPNSSIGKLWDKRAAELVQQANVHHRFQVYPANGKESGNTLYEFRYEPLSFFEKLTLVGCYIGAGIYLAVSLRRLQAVKSRLGLVITVLTQICATIMSSFTILAVFKVPVSHAPRWIFPFVIVVIGLENMFRLINAVIAIPAEQSTAARVSGGLGEVGFVSFVAMLTNLVGLLGFASVLTIPAMSEFCIFACVALAVDYILHMTFFLAVMSVDVRRLELQDSLDRHLNLSSDNEETLDGWHEKKVQGGFMEFLFRGGSPVSTRIAGSAILICFAVGLNMHFLDNQHPMDTLFQLGTILKVPSAMSESMQTQDMPLNVVRSPTAWMRAQDQLTGMELIQAVKPDSARAIAKAFNPIFFVLDGSNRARTPAKMPNILSTLELDIIKDHMQAFVLSVVLVVAGITILMNYLLFSDVPMDEPMGGRKGEGPQLTCQTLIEGHSLDIAIVTTSPKGVIVSVGLDRRIVVWKLSASRQPVTKEVIRPTCSEHILWPVMSTALDHRGEWLAIAPRVGPISFYNCEKAEFFRTIAVDTAGRAPSAFFFAPEMGLNLGPRLIVMGQDGWLSEVYVKTGEIVSHRICTGIVVSSSHGVFTPRLPLRIVTACQRGRIFVSSKSSGDWYTEQLDLNAPPQTSIILEPGEPCTILPLSALGMVISSRSCNVELVDLLSGSIIRSFQTGQFKPSSLRAFHAERRTCLYCGCPSVLSFSIAYNERESGMFMMHTFSSSRGRMRDICLRAERDRRERKCSGFESVIETTHWLENVEGWEPTILNMVAGVRRREISSDEPSSDDYETSNAHSSSLRRRKYQRERIRECADDDGWEAWTMDAKGTVTAYPFSALEEQGMCDDRLMVSRAGPVEKIGQRSVAVGFGNTLKVLYVGNERFEDEAGLEVPHQSHLRTNRKNHRRMG